MFITIIKTENSLSSGISSSEEFFFNEVVLIDIWILILQKGTTITSFKCSQGKEIKVFKRP